MLVLSRKVMEAITIGDHIMIVIVDAKRNRVRLAIDAPAELAVRRVHSREKSAVSDSLEPQKAQVCPAT